MNMRHLPIISELASSSSYNLQTEHIYMVDEKLYAPMCSMYRSS